MCYINQIVLFWFAMRLTSHKMCPVILRKSALYMFIQKGTIFIQVYSLALYSCISRVRSDISAVHIFSWCYRCVLPLLLGFVPKIPVFCIDSIVCCEQQIWNSVLIYDIKRLLIWSSYLILLISYCLDVTSAIEHQVQAVQTLNDEFVQQQQTNLLLIFTSVPTSGFFKLWYSTCKQHSCLSC